MKLKYVHTKNVNYFVCFTLSVPTGIFQNIVVQLQDRNVVFPVCLLMTSGRLRENCEHMLEVILCLSGFGKPVLQFLSQN